MYKCPKCGAPAKHMPPDGDFRYDPPSLSRASQPSQQDFGKILEAELIEVGFNKTIPATVFDACLRAMSKVAPQPDTVTEEMVSVPRKMTVEMKLAFNHAWPKIQEGWDAALTAALAVKV